MHLNSGPSTMVANHRLRRGGRHVLPLDDDETYCISTERPSLKVRGSVFQVGPLGEARP